MVSTRGCGSRSSGSIPGGSATLLIENSMKKLWYVWSKALGEKAHDDAAISDQVALIRTIIIVSYIVTNCVIIAGVIRHW